MGECFSTEGSKQCKPQSTTKTTTRKPNRGYAVASGLNTVVSGETIADAVEDAAWGEDSQGCASHCAECSETL